MFNYGLLHMDTNVGRPAEFYIRQFSVETGCQHKVLLRMMTDRDEE